MKTGSCIRTLFIADVSIQDPASGAEVVLYQQATGIAERGGNVSAITRRTNCSGRIIRNVCGVKELCYTASPETPLRSLLSIAAYPSCEYDRLRRAGPFQIGIAHQPFTCASLLMRRKVGDLPILYIFHSPAHEEYLISKKNEKPWKRSANAFFRKAIERYCLRKADRVMVLSRYMGRKMKEAHGSVIPPIVLNPGGADLNRFVPPEDRIVLKRNLRLPEGKIHFLTVRNLEPRMGIDNLLKAMLLLGNNGSKIHLTIVGDGPERNKLERLATVAGIQNRVSMVGFVDADMLPRYYGAADFFVIPTRRLEGFGLVTVEAMACGTPVLGTPVGGTAEILGSFDESLLFTGSSAQAISDGMQKAIQMHFNDPSVYFRIRKRCRSHVERFYSWQRHLDVLQETIVSMSGIAFG